MDQSPSRTVHVLRPPRTRRVVALALATVAGILVAFSPAADATVVFTVTTPHTGLTTTTPIDVTVTGLTPGQNVGVGQCSADGATCNGKGLEMADASGSLTTTSVAMVILNLDFLPVPPAPVDCRLETCSVVVVNDNFQMIASVPVTFTPTATPPGPATLTPAVGLVDNQAVLLSIPPGHFFPSLPVGAGECIDDPGLLFLCQPYPPSSQGADARDGSVNRTLIVRSGVDLVEAPGHVNCIPAGCSIFVTFGPFDKVFSQFPLSFVPPPLPGSDFHAVPATRILDSRTSVGGWNSPLTAATARELQATDVGGGPSPVPASATSVVMNVTATNATADSFIVVGPADAPKPGASDLNFAQGQTIANLVTARLGTQGGVLFANAIGDVDVIADVVGYYDQPPGGGEHFNGVDPVRVLDSRTTTGGWNSPLLAATPRDVTVRGVGGVPATATSVIANLTATGGSHGSFLKVWPAGSAAPTTSTVNFATGQTIPNLVVVPIGSNDMITIENAVGSVDIVLDVVGYFDPTAGSKYHALSVATRILDDRHGTGLSGAWQPMQSRTLAVGGANGIPATATGLVMNTTVTGATADSFVAVYPSGASVPGTSNLNFAAGETIANLVMSRVSASGQIDIYNQRGSVDIIGDVAGYFSPT